MPTSTLRLAVPDDYLLHRDCCSYGYFLLHPNHWDVKRRVFSRVLNIGAVGGAVGAARSDLAPHAVQIAISQRGDAGSALSVRVEGLAASGGGTTKARALAYEQIRAQITRMLRLDESAETIARFHAVDPRWKESGHGRVFRSPTLFEDVVKTVTSCNVQWPGTIMMNKRLCEVVGAKVKVTKPASGKKGAEDAPAPRAFPLAGPLSRTRPATLRARCRVGYRDQRIVELAKLFATRPEKGGVDQFALESPATSDDQVWDMLLELPGVGPYAAANIMQLLGRYARLPLDTESIRHARTVLGYTGDSRDIMKRLHQHYAPLGVDAFRSYWFELWEFYERKHGRAWTWERDSTGKVFTAALLSK